jgi:hypothetical protein
LAAVREELDHEYEATIRTQTSPSTGSNPTDFSSTSRA